MPPKKRVDSDNTLEKFVDNLRSLLSRINNGTDNLENLLGVVFPRGGWLLEQFVNNFINNRDINRRASMNNTAQSIPAADLLTEDNWNVIRDIYRGILNNKFINEFINKKESINKKTIDTILSILNMVKKHIENIVNYINEHYAPEYTSLVNKFKELLEQIADIKAKLDHIIIPPPKSHVRNSGAMFQPTNGAASSSSDLRPFTPKKRTTTSTKTRSAKRQKTQHPEEQVVNNDEVNLQSPQEQRLLGREKNRKAQMLNDAKSSAVSFNPVTPKNKTTKSSVTTKKKTANTSHASFAKHTEPKTPGNLAVNDKKNIQTPQAQRALLRGIGKLINEEEEVRGNLTDEESVAFLTLEQQLILQNQPPSDLPNVVPETQEQISDSVVNLEGQFDDVADNQPEFDLNAPDIDYQSEFDLNEDAPQEIEWFTDDEMNALLQHYFGNNDDVRLMVAINLFQHGGVLLRQNLEDLQLQQALEQSFTEQAPQRTIIVPINLGNTHWAALHIYFNTEDRTAPEINYFDPFGHRMPLELEEVLREVFTGLQPNDVLWYPIRFQYDGHNCGPWTIAILNSLVNNSGLPDEDFNVNDARIMYRDILRQTVTGAAQPNYRRDDVSGPIVEETETLPSSSSPKSYLPQFDAAQNEQHQIQNNAADFDIHFEVPDSANVRLADRVVDNTTMPESTVNKPEEGLEVRQYNPSEARKAAAAEARRKEAAAIRINAAEARRVAAAEARRRETALIIAAAAEARRAAAETISNQSQDVEEDIETTINSSNSLRMN